MALANIDPGLLLTIGAVGSALAVLILAKAADHIDWRNGRILMAPARRRRLPSDDGRD